MTGVQAGRLLEAHGIATGYGGATVVHDVSLCVEPGEVVALLGPNGAGKTTTLLALVGVLPLSAGRVKCLGSEKRKPLHKRAREGLSFVSEERTVFTRLSTRQNLALARGLDLDRATQLFPELISVMSRRGGLLSGGEQQMLTLARALCRPAKLLLADELSMGLAPKTVGRLLQTIRKAADEGLGALLVEQHVHRVLEVADRVYVLRNGHVEFQGTAAEARAQLEDIQHTYLSHARANGRASTGARPLPNPGNHTEGGQA